MVGNITYFENNFYGTSMRPRRLILAFYSCEKSLSDLLLQMYSTKVVYVPSNTHGWLTNKYIKYCYNLYANILFIERTFYILFCIIRQASFSKYCSTIVVKYTKKVQFRTLFYLIFSNGAAAPEGVLAESKKKIH